MRQEETDVVIVGGSIAGFAMAVEVFRRGLSARVLRQDAEGARASRLAAVYQPPALESFARLEIYDAMRAEGAVISRWALHAAGSAEPAAVLDLAGLDTPFPHALGIAHAPFQSTCLDAFARYSAIRIEQGVELLSLLHERGRVTGAVARGPEGNVTYRAKVVVVTTNEGGAPVRAETGAATRNRPYGDEHAGVLVERPDGWGELARSWLGRGLAIAAYPVGRDRLCIEAVARTGLLSRARAGGPGELARWLATAAPGLDLALKSLPSTDAMHLTPCSRSRLKAWVGDAVALIGPAAHHMSPVLLAPASQAILDAAALTKVLSRCQFTGDFSRLALLPFEAARRRPAEQVAALSHAAHRLALAPAGMTARELGTVLDRLARSPALAARLTQAVVGLRDVELGLADRLRLVGLLPRPQPAATRQPAP